MNAATAAALLLFAAGFLQSFSLMCRKLPAARQPASYPPPGAWRNLFDLGWILLLAAGLSCAFLASVGLGILAGVVYFFILPFVFQLPLARLLGFASFRDYLNTVGRR